MPKVLPLPFKAMFIVIEPVLTYMGAWSAFTAPEWYLASQLPGPTITGLLHTQETNMLVRLYGVLLICLASVSLAVFPVIANNTDRLSISIARRLLFVLAGKPLRLMGLIVVGDVIHIYTAGLHIGEKAVMDVANWNDMTWGNIGITVMLLVSRILWFLSVGIKKVEDGKKKA